MQDLTRLLRDGDPAADDPGLSVPEITAMRRVVLTSIKPQPLLAAAWQRPLAVAAMIALTLAGGIVTGHRMAPAERAPAVPDPVSARGGERRQLQFATPGGTRIIWVFDSEFDLKETTP